MYHKYIKYKTKYLELQRLIGGSKLEQPNFTLGKNVKFSLKKKPGKIFVGTITFKLQGENGPMLRVQYNDAKKIDILESQAEITNELPTTSDGKDNTAAAESSLPQNVEFILKKKPNKIFVGTITYRFQDKDVSMLRVQFNDGKKIDILESQGKLTDELPTTSDGKDNTAAVSLTTASTDSAAAIDRSQKASESGFSLSQSHELPKLPWDLPDRPQQKAVSVPLTEDLDLINGNILYADFIKYLNLPSDDSKAIFTFADFHPNPITLAPVLKQKFIDSYSTEQNKRWMGKTFLKKRGKKDNDLRTGSGYAIWDDGISFFNAITYRPPNNSNFTAHPTGVFNDPADLPPVDRNGNII